LISVLSATDMTYLFWTSVSNFVFLGHQQFIGGSIVCQATDFMLIFLLMCSVGTLTAMSTHLRLRVTSPSKRKLPLIPIFCGIWIVAFIWAFVVTIAPGKSVLTSSGIYCYADVKSAPFYIALVFAVSLLVFLSFNYFQIYRYYVKITKDQKEDVKISERKWRLLKRFSLFVLVTLVSYVPFIVSLFYEWGSGYYSPALIDNIVYILVNISCVCNPLLYFWSNKSALQVLKFELRIVDHLSSSDGKSVVVGTGENSTKNTLTPNELNEQ